MAATPFHFAWANASETTFGDEHKIEAEKIVSFSIEHNEGDFATLSLVVRNPRIGLLAPARKTWAWLAYGNTPLFFGRLVGVPNDIHQELVTLQFVARPADFVAQKEAIAETLKVLPYYDPVWLTPEAQDDPDTVLEAYPLLWHVDRTTGEVSTSHILTGEDGTEEFQDDEVPYDSVRVSIAQVPLRSVTVDGMVTWNQSASGEVALDLGERTFLTYTGKSIIDKWPKPEQSLGGGWRVVSAAASDDWNVDGTDTLSYSMNWTNTAKKHSPGDTMSQTLNSTVAPLQGPSKSVLLTLHTVSGVGEASVDRTNVRVPVWQISTQLALGYDASRARKEHVRFTLSADLQPIVTLPGEDETFLLNMTGADVGIPLPSTDIPLDDPARRSYFSTDRGLQSLEYLIALARARLFMAARAVEVEFTCRFQRAIALSCRLNARVFDDRLPGGQAEGKIRRYTLTGDGDSGAVLGSVTIACSIGYGGVIEVVDGDPLYCEEGYVNAGYQAYSGQTVVLDESVSYTVPTDAPVDDGLSFPLTRDQVVIAEEWHGSIEEQSAAIDAAGVVPAVSHNLFDKAPPFDAAKEIPPKIEAALLDKAHWYELTLKNLAGTFETVYEIDVSQVKIPQGINLEAAS